MNLPPLILASASPRRAALLRGMGLEFRVIVSDAPEIHREQLTARELCLVNAYRKARAVAKQHPDTLVLGADTLVHLANQIFGKPATLTAAEAMLTRLQGRTHQVVTGVCLLHLRGHRQRIFAVTSDVTFQQLEAEQIRRYLQLVSPFDKAGAYGIQEQGALIVEEVFGSFTNVVGLPVEHLRVELSRWADTGQAQSAASAT